MIEMRRRPALLLTCLLCTPACSLPSASQVVDGPSFTLDAEHPVAAFEVELCVSGPALDYASAHAQVLATLHAVDGVGATVSGQALDAPIVEEDDAYDPHAESLAVPAEDEAMSFWLVTEGGPWQGGGRRCHAVQAVQFELDASADRASFDVDWQVAFHVEYDNGLFGGAGLDDDDLEVTIQRL